MKIILFAIHLRLNFKGFYDFVTFKIIFHQLHWIVESLTLLNKGRLYIPLILHFLAQFKNLHYCLDLIFQPINECLSVQSCTVESYVGFN